MKLSKFQIAVILGILLVGLVAFIDIQGINLIGEDYINGLFDISVWYHHLVTALIVFSIIPICYWFFFRKDKSEVFAIFLTGLTMFYFGLADILFFWFQKLPVPETLPWLNNHIIIGKISMIFGYYSVTNTSLYISVIIGGVLTYYLVKYLKNKW